MAYPINSRTAYAAQWGNTMLTKSYVDQNVEYQLHESKPNSITLNAGADEMIRVAPDGFYVRGVKVPVDDKEAETVYLAFKQWLAWANLQRK